MTKLMIKVENNLNELVTRVKNKINNEDGFTAIEVFGIGILIIGLIVMLKPLIFATGTKIAGIFDTIMVDKINAIK